MKVLPRALRAALPLFAGQGVVLVAGFALNAALVGWVFRDDPAAMGRFGVLSEALQWITVVALMGLPAAVLRFLPERPAQRGALLRTAAGATVLAASVLALVCAFPVPLGRLLAGDAHADLLIYGFRAVPLCALAVVTAALHAEGRLARKAVIEGLERVAVLVGGLAGALAAGFSGLLWGVLAGSLVAWGFAWAAVRAPADGPAVATVPASVPFRPLLRVGAPQMALSLLETLRPLVLVRVAQETLDPATLGHLTTAKTFALPLVIAPELLAQALFPGMHGPAGEGEHVERDRRRFVLEVAAGGLVVCGVYAACAAWLLPQAGSGKYAGAVLPLVAFIPGVLAQGATAHTGYVLLVRDRLPLAAAVSGVSLAVTAGLTFALVAPWGAVGGALAMSGGLVVRAGLLLLLAGRSAARPGRPA